MVLYEESSTLLDIPIRSVSQEFITCRCSTRLLSRCPFARSLSYHGLLSSELPGINDLEGNIDYSPSLVVIIPIACSTLHILTSNRMHFLPLLNACCYT